MFDGSKAEREFNELSSTSLAKKMKESDIKAIPRYEAVLKKNCNFRTDPSKIIVLEDLVDY